VVDLGTKYYIRVDEADRMLVVTAPHRRGDGRVNCPLRVDTTPRLTRQ